MDPGQLLPFQLAGRYHGSWLTRSGLFSSAFYKATLALALMGLILLLFGKFQLLALAILSGFLYYQNLLNFKYHTCYFALIASALTVDSAIQAFAGSSEMNWLAPAMVSTITSALYIFSAYRKALEAEFTSGFSVGITLKHLALEGKRRLYRFDNGLSVLKVNFLGPKAVRYGSVAVIGLELALPILLYVREFRFLGVVLGVTMHVVFTLIAPRTLLHFSLLTILTYSMF